MADDTILPKYETDRHVALTGLSKKLSANRIGSMCHISFECHVYLRLPTHRLGKRSPFARRAVTAEAAGSTPSTPTLLSASCEEKVARL